MDHKIDRIFEKLSDLAVDVGKLLVSVEKNTDDLATHIKRTNLLEKKIEFQDRLWQDKLDEALIPVRWGKTTLALLAGSASLYGFVQLITYLTTLK